MIPTSRKGGWNLVVCLSGNTTPAGMELGYWSVEDECIGIGWVLKEAKQVVPKCNNLLIMVDHKLVQGTIGDKELSAAKSPKLARLHGKTPLIECTKIYIPDDEKSIMGTAGRFPLCRDESFGYNLIILEKGSLAETYVRTLLWN